MGCSSSKGAGEPDRRPASDKTEKPTILTAQDQAMKVKAEEICKSCSNSDGKKLEGPTEKILELKRESDRLRVK